VSDTLRVPYQREEHAARIITADLRFVMSPRFDITCARFGAHRARR